MKKSFRLNFIAGLVFSSSAIGGPYPPAATQPGSTAISRSAPSIVTWADRFSDYTVGAECWPRWQQPGTALGPAGNDPLEVVCLGEGGQITLRFPGFIKNGPGPDFAIFENGFADGFIELAHVEVSSDGINFFRFPGYSLTPSPVPAFGTIDPTNVSQLGSKYRVGYGEPYDLATLGLTHISHVRLLDITGNGSVVDAEGRPIYDPTPTSQSAGFDLDAIAALHLTPWRTFTVATWNGQGTNSVALSHRNDGRFVLGWEGRLAQQNAWGAAAITPVPTGGVSFDPAFIALGPQNQGLLGAGAGLGLSSPVHALNLTALPSAVGTTPLATLQNYAGTWWSGSSPETDGWLIAGTHGTNDSHAVSYLSPDGTRVGLIADELSSFSGGLAVDPVTHDVYVGLYEIDLSNPTAPDEVLVFSRASIEAAIRQVKNNAPQPLRRAQATKVWSVPSAGSLAVDAWGRLWSAGYKNNHLHLFDPVMGQQRVINPQPAGFSPNTDVIYILSQFSRRADENYLSWIAADETATVGSPLVYGEAPLTALPTLATWSSWRDHYFHANERTPATEALLWGPTADPDGDSLPNLLEYAQATHPRSFDPPASILQVNINPDQELAVRSQRDLRPSDVRLIVESTATLATDSWQRWLTAETTLGWQKASSLTNARRLITHQRTTETVQLLTPWNRETRFWRIRAELIP